MSKLLIVLLSFVVFAACSSNSDTNNGENIKNPNLSGKLTNSEVQNVNSYLKTAIEFQGNSTAISLSEPPPAKFGLFAPQELKGDCLIETSPISSNKQNHHIFGQRCPIEVSTDEFLGQSVLFTDATFKRHIAVKEFRGDFIINSQISDFLKLRNEKIHNEYSGCSGVLDGYSFNCRSWETSYEVKFNNGDYMKLLTITEGEHSNLHESYELILKDLKIDYAQKRNGPDVFERSCKINDVEANADECNRFSEIFVMLNY